MLCSQYVVFEQEVDNVGGVAGELMLNVIGGRSFLVCGFKSGAACKVILARCAFGC